MLPSTLAPAPIITLAPILYPKNPYDTLTDLTPVGFVSNVPAVLLVHPALAEALAEAAE